MPAHRPTEYITAQPVPDKPKQDPLGRNAAAAAAAAASAAKAAKKNARRAAARQRKQEQGEQVGAEDDDDREGSEDETAEGAAVDVGFDGAECAEVEEDEGAWARVHRQSADGSAVWVEAEAVAAWAAVMDDTAVSVPQPSPADAGHGGSGWSDVYRAADAGAAWAAMFGDEGAPGRSASASAAAGTVAASATAASFSTVGDAAAQADTHHVVPREQQPRPTPSAADGRQYASAALAANVIDWLKGGISCAAAAQCATPSSGDARDHSAAAATAAVTSSVHMQGNSSIASMPSAAGTTNTDLRGMLLNRLTGHGSTTPHHAAPAATPGVSGECTH